MAHLCTELCLDHRRLLLQLHSSYLNTTLLQQLPTGAYYVPAHLLPFLPPCVSIRQHDSRQFEV